MALVAAWLILGCSASVEGDPICFDYCGGEIRWPVPASFVYVANNINGSGTVSAYQSDETTGALTGLTGSPYAAGGNPNAIATNGSELFVANSTSSSISAYFINHTVGTGGSLINVTGSPFSTGAGTAPRAMVISRSRNVLYVVSSSTDSVLAFTITPSGGLAALGTPVATGSAPLAIAIHRTEKFAYVANSGSNDVWVYTIDQTNGTLTSAGPPVPAGTGPGAILAVPLGDFVYVANFNSSDVSVYTANATTGALTAAGTVSAGSGPVSLAAYQHSVFGGIPKFLYVANLNSNNISAYSIDSTTGALTSIGSPVAAGVAPRSLAIRPRADFFFAANAGSADVSGYAINATTGVLTPFGARVPAGANAFAITSARVVLSPF